MIKVLFVCLGNICRSPMAEGIFENMLSQKSLHNNISCDSAGTSDYHIGELPDIRMQQTALQYHIKLTHRARQLTKQDFEIFDYIVAMDESNYINITRHPGWNDEWNYKLVMMRSYDEVATSLNVPDPYFGDINGFETVYQMLLKANTCFLNFLVKKHQL